MIDSKLDDPMTLATARHRNILFGGLALALRGFPALLWTYALSLGLALLFSFRFYGQWSALLSHSLAAQSLTSGFDLGALFGGFSRLSEHVPGGNQPSLGGLLLFGVVWFLFVPGTLFCYATGARTRLSTLLRSGIEHFWRFVRITLFTLILGGIIVGLLLALNSALANKIDEHLVGRPAFVLEAIGAFVVFLVAMTVRLYFDLVEVYTVQLGVLTSVGPNARPDRRVRKTLRPAWRTLTRHFASAWLCFLLLTLLGLGALVLSVRFAAVSLAQPRVWPAFAMMQLGLFFNLFTRFWQRGVETVLAQNHPLPFTPSASVRPVFTTSAPTPAAPFSTTETPVAPVHPVITPEPPPRDLALSETPPPEIV